MLNTKQYNELEYIISLIDVERWFIEQGDEVHPTASSISIITNDTFSTAH